MNRILSLTLFFPLTLCLGFESFGQWKPVRHTVMSDGHPITVWEKSAPYPRQCILLVHGRTWSAIPDFDLQVEGEELSLMDGLAKWSYAVYAIDLRGYGDTPRDSSDWATPDQSARDIANVLKYIQERRGYPEPPHLFGWSMGSTLSQLTAQRHPELMSSLTLFGYWRDSDQVFPAEPEEHPEAIKQINTAEAAASDFIAEGSISENAIDAYVKAALAADPVKVDLRRFDQFNELDPAKVTVPTLIIQGEHDPIAPGEYQSKLFNRLGTTHKQWIVIPGGDHAAFLENPRIFFLYHLNRFFEGVDLLKK